MSYGEPLSNTTSNPGWDDRWTCPACYQDYEGSEHDDTTINCNCGHSFKCYIEQQPVCKAELMTEG